MANDEMTKLKKDFLEISGHLNFMYKKMREISSKISELSGEYQPMADLLDNNDPRGRNWEDKSEQLKNEIESMRETGFPEEAISLRLNELKSVAVADSKTFKEMSKEFNKFMKQAKMEGIDDYLDGELSNVADTYKQVKNISLSSMKEVLN